MLIDVDSLTLEGHARRNAMRVTPSLPYRYLAAPPARLYMPNRKYRGALLRAARKVLGVNLHVQISVRSAELSVFLKIRNASAT